MHGDKCVRHELTQRLNQIEPKVSEAKFLSGEGIGNEIACYIFDYDAEDELEVRKHVANLISRIETHRPELRVLHLDLLDVAVEYLSHRKFLDKAIKMQVQKGDVAVLKALGRPMDSERVRDFIGNTYHPGNYDLVFLSGVGSVWPMMRAHSLLNCLHTIMNNTPLVMFYPGSFDGATLRLFGRITTERVKPNEKPYYRAFNLVPREKQS